MKGKSQGWLKKKVKERFPSSLRIFKSVQTRERGVVTEGAIRKVGREGAKHRSLRGQKEERTDVALKTKKYIFSKKHEKSHSQAIVP